MRRALALAVLAAGCGPPGREAAPVPRHLVLVTIDTLRADRLGCYGSRDVATPHLDRLAREGAMAPEAAAAVPLTRPSHVSLFTGLEPSEHGVRDNISPALAPGIPTLAEILKGAGFQTAGFVSSVVLSAQSGLQRGFDTYSDRFELGADDARFLNMIQKRGDLATGEAVAWIESHRQGRAFVWLHLYDPHDPYDPPEPYASRYPGRPYDGEVAWSDELVGRLDDALERLGLRGETLLAVTSDHGEGLEEHGEPTHGFFVYQTTLRVPLLLRGPGVRPGSRVGVTFRSIDLLPTLLDLLGVSKPPSLRLTGRSLGGELRGGPTPVEEAAYAECLTPLLHFGWSDLRALREGRWKYVQAPRPELYDLAADPGETRNLVPSEPARVEAFRAQVARRLEAERTREGAAQGAAGVPLELLERLGALGYLGGGTPARGASAAADPKDHLDDYKTVNRLMREGLLRLQAKDYATSARRFTELLGLEVESFEVHYYLGRALVGLGRTAEAAGHFEAAARRLPAFGPAHVALADCRALLGDPKAAVAALRRGQAASPRDARLYRAEAALWKRLGRPRNAIRAYEQVLLLAPEDALVRVQLGEAWRDAGDLDRAARLMREALALDASDASYWNALGMVLGASGSLGEAEKAFREAVGRGGHNAEYAYNLGLVLVREARPGEAAVFLRKALEIDPRFGPARDRLGELGSR